MAARMHTLLSGLIALSIPGLSVSECLSGQSCEAFAEADKVRSLLQVNQGYKSVQEHAHSALAEECVWKCYIQRYPDLAGLDEATAAGHYAQYGSKEGRDCTCRESGCKSASSTLPKGQIPQRPITFITNYDPSFETSLSKTSLWINRASLPHQWLLLNNTNNDCISSVYAFGQSKAVHDLQVFLHSDIFLQEDFYDTFMTKLQSIETMDPNWGVLGTAGMDIWVQRENVSIRSCITDPHGAFDTGEDNLEVQSLDESLMVLRRSSPKFDPALPGFDMYGTDIVLSAKQSGKKSYLLNLASVSHKTMNPDGDEDIQEEFIDKVNSQTYEQRLDTTMSYFQKKWCPAGFLPVMAPVFKVECNHWESYIG